MATAALLGLSAGSAHALFPKRYVACKEEAAAAAAPAAPPVKEQWLPLAKRRAPRLSVAPLDVDDVAQADPMPSRRATRRPQSKLAVLVHSRNDYRCIGLLRGEAGMVRVIAAPPGTRFFGHGFADSWRQTNMRAAGAFARRKAIGALRRELARPIPQDAEPWRQHQLRRNKHYAARALADLRDTASAQNVLGLLRSLERDGFNLWRDTLDTLPRLDPARAQAYALELLRRVTRQPSELRKNSRLITDVLPLVVRPTPEVQAVVERAALTLTTKDAAPRGSYSGACELVIARVRLGDRSLRDELRAELATDLRTQRGVACYSKWMPVLFPGHDAAEAPVWMHRQRYRALLTWLARTRSRSSARNNDVRRRLLIWLRSRSTQPDVAGDKRDRRYVPNKRARHLAALAALGDAAAQRALDQLIADPQDQGTAPWIAALQALKLNLPGAAEAAERRLRLGILQRTRRLSNEPWERRGAVRITEQGRVIEELARRGDDRFVLGMLSRSVFDREVAARLLARRRPRRACDIVGAAASRAQREVIEDAFWALSVLGRQCRQVMQRLATDPAQPPAVRGMATEYLAMLRHMSVPRVTAVLARDRRYRPSVRRARIIYSARE